MGRSSARGRQRAAPRAVSSATSRRGFTLVELAIVVAIIGVLAAVAIPLYANMQERARIAKVKADIRMIATALGSYMAQCDGLPGQDFSQCTGPMGGLLPLTTVHMNQGTSPPTPVGPLLPQGVPPPPGGWSTYWYSPRPNLQGFIVGSMPTGSDNGGRAIMFPWM